MGKKNKKVTNGFYGKPISSIWGWCDGIEQADEVKISDKIRVSGLNLSKLVCTLTTNCITLQDGQTAKICVDNGQTKIMIENKEVKKEEPKFKKGDVLSYTDYGNTWIIILNDVDKFDTQYLCMLGCYGGIFHDGVCKNVNWSYATEKEKRSLFLAMLNQGMFWDEKKMKVRTLKDGDIISIKDHNGDTWQSIFKEIIDNRIYSYFSLDCDGELYKKGPIGHPNQILSIRYSTTKERQTLFDKIEEKEHKKWNAETKNFENIRWRAKKGETYWCITKELHVESYIEENDSIDKAMGEINNKFQTQEIAEAAANQIKELLSKL